MRNGRNVYVLGFNWIKPFCVIFFKRYWILNRFEFFCVWTKPVWILVLPRMCKRWNECMPNACVCVYNKKIAVFAVLFVALPFFSFRYRWVSFTFWFFSVLSISIQLCVQIDPMSVLKVCVFQEKWCCVQAFKHLEHLILHRYNKKFKVTHILFAAMVPAIFAAADRAWFACWCVTFSLCRACSMWPFIGLKMILLVCVSSFASSFTTELTERLVDVISIFGSCWAYWDIVHLISISIYSIPHQSIFIIIIEHTNTYTTRH